MRQVQSWLSRFAVRGVLWRHYLDWAVSNLPHYLHFVLLCFWTLFFFFFAAPARRALLANFAVVFPRSSRLVNYARVFRTLYNFAWTITDAATYRLLRAEFSYEIRGNAILDELAAAPGAIVLTAHMGNYDLGAALFAQKFARPIRMVRAPEFDPDTEQHLKKSIAEAGEGSVKIDYNTAGALLSFDLLNALRAGEIVSIQGDRIIGAISHVDGRMFGHRIAIPSGPFILARTSGAPIFPLFVVRLGYRRYGVAVFEPVLIARTADRAADVARGVESWCRTLEQMVREHWHQWFALDPVFTAHV